MPHDSPQFADASLASLRALELSGPAEPEKHIVPDVFLSWDAAASDMEVTLASRPGELLTIETRVRRAPGWFTLTLNLGRDSFERGDVLGLVADASADRERRLDLFVRTSEEGKLRDTLFREPLVVGPRRRSAVALHTLGAGDPACRLKEHFFALVLRLPKEDVRLALHDLRFFVVPADRGLRSAPRDLTTAAD